MQGKWARYLSFLIVLSITTTAVLAEPEKSSKQLRPNMQKLFLDVQQLLPYYLDKEQFNDLGNTKKIESLLQSIVDQAEAVEVKTSKLDSELQMYGDNFESGAKGALSGIQSGARSQAYFHLEELLGSCFSCHSSRPTDSKSSFADLNDRLDWSQLNEFYRPKVLTISRRFEQAASEYESLLLRRGLSMEELLHFDPLSSYLILSVRVLNDKRRAEKTFASLLKKDYPRLVKKDVEVWLMSLKELIERDSQTKPYDLNYAKSLIDKGKLVMDYPRDQSAMVYYVEASRILKDLLQDTKAKAGEKAELAYYLGISELVIANSLIGLEAQHYFEQVISLSPKSEIAKKAFDLYKESLIFGYSGSSGLHLPASEKAKLEALRKQAF